MSDAKSLGEKRGSVRSVAHLIVRLARDPLCVHRHLGPVQTAVQCGSDEAWRMADSCLRRANQQFDQSCLLLWRDGENVDDRHRTIALGDCQHEDWCPSTFSMEIGNERNRVPVA